MDRQDGDGGRLVDEGRSGEEVEGPVQASAHVFKALTSIPASPAVGACACPVGGRNGRVREWVRQTEGKVESRPLVECREKRE